jgi:hypothetical protein
MAILVRERPPLDLAVELTDAEGVTRNLGGQGARGGDVPQGLQLSTKRGEGFSTAGFRLSRRIDRDWPDLNLYDGIVIASATGDVAWEGRLSRPPRSMDQAHSISVEAIGWMAHARDQPMSMIYVDRDLGAWQPMSSSRRAAKLNGSETPFDFAVQPDSTNNLPSLYQSIKGPWATVAGTSEAVYDAGSICRLGNFFYEYAAGPTVITADSNWHWSAAYFDDDTLAGTGSASGELRGPGTTGYLPAAAAKRVLNLQFYYGGSGASDNQEYGVRWYRLAVYGDHGLPLIGTSDPKGVAASDVIKHIFSS